MNAWGYLALAIAFEVAGTFLLKLSDGFSRLHWGLFSVACYFACFAALAPAMRMLPVGLVYAIWAGVGIVAATLLGALVFGERLSLLQLLCVGMILIGAVFLNLLSHR